MLETVYVRLRLVLLVFGALALVVIVQLLRVDFGSTNVTYFRKLSNQITQQSNTYAPARGRIYDRWGELLATNDVEYELGVDPPYVVDTTDMVSTLSTLAGVPSLDVEAAIKSTKPYVLLKRPISAAVGDKLKGLLNDSPEKYSGLDLTPIAHRIYPGGSLAAQVLGFVAYNNDGQQLGYFGVEGFYNDLLGGRAVQSVQQMVPFDAALNPVPDQGADLYLTLDRNIQFLTEATLADGIKQYGASGGTIIVMNPRSGEILGMASSPTFDPNNYVTDPPGNPANPAVSGQYEPGSTFKVLTMAGALDAGTVKVDTPFVDTGSVEVGGIIINNWNDGAWGPVDMLGCMQHSLNVCLASVATWMGPNTFYNYMQAFGIGHLTNVDLAAETAGRLKLPGATDWFDSDLGTNSFGQGVAVSPLQLITAASAIANGGTMMQPHILKIVQHGVSQHVTQQQVLGRPIKPETAATENEMLARSLELGEGSQALVDGYRVSGKTGTAQIPTPSGYDPDQTIASFIGWGPTDDPQFIVLIKLDKPTSSIWGSETAAPLFKQLVTRLVVLMQIPPDSVRHALQSGTASN
jgi:cell division protein FtsI/penicillin-binding protein 2